MNKNNESCRRRDTSAHHISSCYIFNAYLCREWHVPWHDGKCLPLLMSYGSSNTYSYNGLRTATHYFQEMTLTTTFWTQRQKLTDQPSLTTNTHVVYSTLWLLHAFCPDLSNVFEIVPTALSLTFPWNIFFQVVLPLMYCVCKESQNSLINIWSIVFNEQRVFRELTHSLSTISLTSSLYAVDNTHLLTFTLKFISNTSQYFKEFHSCRLYRSETSFATQGCMKPRCRTNVISDCNVFIQV